MTDISSQTLHIVAKELTATLNDARAALEAYAERPTSALLEKCAEQLHSAHGVLRLVEVYGAALLAEEMEHVTRYLLSSGNDQKRQVDGLDALMRAMVQLPTYLERVLSGGRDLGAGAAAAAQRFALGARQSLAVRGTLLLLNLKSDQPAQPQSQRQGEQSISVAQWARRLRPRFQIGLAGIHPRRTHRAESGNSGEGRRKARTGRHHAARVPVVVGHRRDPRGGARQRLGGQRDT
jgi:chemosensory pili system protein ChpA (sensor histidine kinase/response regulator)